MKIHSNAVLTHKQRLEVQRLFATGQYSTTQLANHFATTRKTIAKWVKRSHSQDITSAPKQHASRVSHAYRQAHPTHGPVRIEYQLRAGHRQASIATARQ